MIIAIDESGDAGKKFWRGSSQWFVVSAVVIASDHRQAVYDAITTFRHVYRFHDELHFAHNPPSIQNDFLAAMEQQPYQFVSYAMRKPAVLRTKPWIFRSRLALYNYALSRLFATLHGIAEQPVVYIDRNGGRWFSKAITRNLYKQYGMRHKGDRRGIKVIHTVDSVEQPLIQLADYIAGATNHFVQRYSDADLYTQHVQSKGQLIIEGADL